MKTSCIKKCLEKKKNQQPLIKKEKIKDTMVESCLKTTGCIGTVMGTIFSAVGGLAYAFSDHDTTSHRKGGDDLAEVGMSALIPGLIVLTGSAVTLFALKFRNQCREDKYNEQLQNRPKEANFI